jgi:hypothetical protein
MKRPLLVQGMWGLGDNCFARPFIRAACETYDVFLQTPWPELYEDLPIRFVRIDRKLRTQQKNVDRQLSSRWHSPPKGARWLKVSYGQELRYKTIIGAIGDCFARFGIKWNSSPFELPAFSPPPFISQRPIAIVRPATLRKEWFNQARNPLPQYLGELARKLAETHEVVAVADLDDGQEWLDGEMPFAHRSYVKGELDIRSLLALVQTADVIVGGVGWIVPVSIACRRKAFVVLGGNGGHNHPNKITDPRMDLSRIAFAYPPRFCPCTLMVHRCNKMIPDLMAQFDRWTVEQEGRRAA